METITTKPWGSYKQASREGRGREEAKVTFFEDRARVITNSTSLRVQFD
jgi:hypothetical protein